MRQSLLIALVVVGTCIIGASRAGAQSPDLMKIWIGQFTQQELSPVLRPPTCDIAARIAGTASDHDLASASLSYDTTLHSYVEVRNDVLKTYKDYRKDIALRVLDTTTCTTQIITVTKSYGKDAMTVPVATRAGTKWVTKTEPVAVLEAPKGWEMTVVQRANGIAWNNWNTQFDIASPSDRIVVGVKYPIVYDTPKRGQARVTEFVNVPYSEPIAIPQVIASGPQYIKKTMDAAVAVLRQRGVMSRSIPDRLVADMVAAYPAAFPIEKIMPIEHMDLTEFILDPLWTTNRVYATIGANGDAFASFTCSPVGACGPQQFMAGTYATVRRNYPAAGLIPDADTGRRTALNSMEAAILLLDMQLSDYVNAFGDGILTDPHIDELQFAGYNTGTKRVTAVYRIALKQQLPDWLNARGRDCRRPTYRQCLLSETVGYVGSKFRYLRDTYTAAASVALQP